MPTYTLYGCPNTASTGIRFILEELAPAGVSYEFENISLPDGEQKTPAYRAVNAKARVPALVIDGHPVSEAGAIAMLLAERHASPISGPRAGEPARARFLETHTFIVNSLLPALRDWFYADKDQDSKDYAHGIRLLTLNRLKNIYAVLDAQLAESKCLVGDEPSVTDLLAAATLSWDGSIDAIAAKFPNLRRWRDEMRARPAWKAVAEKEGIDVNDLGVKPWAAPYLHDK